MYYKLDRSKLFLKDIQKIKFTNQHYLKYAVYLGKLLSQEKLPLEANDHKLKVIG